MKIRVAVSVIALITGLVAAHRSGQMTLADISVCTNCGAAITVDNGTAGFDYNFTVPTDDNFNNLQH